MRIKTGRTLRNRKFSSTLLVKYIVLLFFAIIMVYPLAWMVMSSLRPEAEIFNEAARTGTYTLDNYRSGWKGPTGVSFGRYFANSFQMVFFMVVGNVISCSLAAFAFSRLKFTGKRVFFAVMLGSMMLPYHVVLIPRYVIFNKLQWINTYLPMTVPKFLATDGFFIYLITQFMRGIPVELDQSAAIDGCGSWKIFTKIILPLSTSALITTIIFSFIWGWNDFFSQLLYISKPEKMTVSLGLRLFLDATGKSNWGGLFAMSTASLIPVLIIFIAFQKYLVNGITATGIKG